MQMWVRVYYSSYAICSWPIIRYMHKLAVKLHDIERRKRTTGILHITAGFYLLLKTVDYFGLQHYAHFLSVLPFFIASLISLLYGFLKKFRDPQARLNRWVRLMQVCAFTVLAIEFSVFGKTLSAVVLLAWAIGCLLLMFTERKVFHEAEMLFSRDGIFIPGYFNNRRL